MKKRVSWLLVFLMIAVLPISVIAEGLIIENDWSDEQSVAAVEEAHNAIIEEILSEKVERDVPEVERTLMQDKNDLNTESEYSQYNTQSHGFPNEVMAAGDFEVYSNDKEFNIRGNSIKASLVGNQNNCWSYANAIYKKIWATSFTSDFQGSADAGWNMLRDRADENRKLTVENLKSYIGASEVGAVIRITSCTSSCSQWNNDGLSCGHKGHSLIIVGKDGNGVYIIDNHKADNVNYSVNTRYYTWQGFINYWGSYSYIKYIIYQHIII